MPRSLAPTRLAKARSRSGEIPFDLTISNPTLCGLPYPEDLLAPLADPTGLEYRPDPRGPLPAREAIAHEYERWGASVDPDTVVLTASTSEAYSLLLQLLCDPGDTILTPTPSYPLFEQLSRLDGVAIEPYILDPEDDWRPDLRRIEDAPGRTRAIIQVHPNNPTGNHVHPEDAAVIAELCRDRGWALITDEVFLPFTLDGGPGSDRSLASGDSCLSFTLGGFSKSLGLPQLKLAWIIVGGPDKAVSEALDRLDYITDAYLSVSTPIALAAPKLMCAAAPIRRSIAERCRVNLKTLREAAAAVPSATVPHTGGGWSAMLRIPAIIDDEELSLRLLEQRGVAVQPGYLFDLPTDGVLVLSLLTPETVWRDGLEAVFETVRSLS